MNQEIYTDIKGGIENYFTSFCRVNGDMAPITLYPKRVELINKIKDNQFNLIYKSRQVGGTTLMAAIAAMTLATAEINKPENIMTIHCKTDLGVYFIENVRNFLNQLPREFWGPSYLGSEENLKRDIFIINRKDELKLPNGSRVKAVATSSLKGYNPTWVIMDEAAFINRGNDIFGTILTAMATSGRLTLISTPNGQDRLFWKTYDDALRGNNSFGVSRVMWYEDPRFNHDLIWEKDGDVIIETQFTTESYKLKERAGFKPSSTWYRNMCRALYHPDSISQELDARFI